MNITGELDQNSWQIRSLCFWKKKGANTKAERSLSESEKNVGLGMRILETENCLQKQCHCDGSI